MVTNLKVAVRGFLRTPGFTATALTTLALCLGANLAIFAVIDSVLLRPLPFPASEELVTVFNSYPRAGVDRDGVSVTNYYERRGKIPAFSSISVVRPGSVVIGDAASSERMEVMRVSPEFFTTLGVGPVIGRGFREEETSYETDDVAVLTDGYWRQHFGADPGVVGRTMRVDGEQVTVVGVLPPEFRYLSSEARVLFPLASGASARGPDERYSGNDIAMVARLAPGASLREAKAQIDAQDAALLRESPAAKTMADAGFHSVVLPLHADHVASIRPVLLLLQSGVFLLLLIGGVNLVNLLLIRASGRSRELAIRQSMGASRRHVVGQAVLETVMLTVGGGALGLAVGAAGIRLLGALGVDRLPLGAQVAFDGRLAAISLLGAAVLGLVLAGPVAWFNLRGQPANGLRSESRGGTGSRASQRLRHGFIVAQVSLAFVLLAGSGLLGLSLERAMEVSPGFRPDHVIAGRLTLPRASYAGVASYVSFTDRLLEQVRRQPGVAAAGAVTNIPLSGNNIKSAITVRGHVLRPGESLQGHYTSGVTGDYFAALGIPLREGRLLTADDTHRPDRICVVDEDFATRYWPQGGAIGRQLFFGGAEGTPDEAFTIVGVVGAVKQAEVTDRQAQGAVYFPFAHRADAGVFVVARVTGDPEPFGATLARVVREVDPGLPLDGVRTMDARISDSLVARRSPALLAGIFAGVALLLAAVGTYGVLSYAVAQRRREIGVRLALGAEPRQIGGQFLALGLHLLAGGTVLGVLGTWMAGRFMQSLLFDVPALHLAILAGTAAVMGSVSLVACLIPARRASKVDPLIAMGGE